MKKIEKLEPYKHNDITRKVDELVDAVNELNKIDNENDCLKAQNNLLNTELDILMDKMTKQGHDYLDKQTPEPRKEQIEICSSCYKQGWDEARKWAVEVVEKCWIASPKSVYQEQFKNFVSDSLKESK